MPPPLANHLKCERWDEVSDVRMQFSDLAYARRRALRIGVVQMLACVVCTIMLYSPGRTHPNTLLSLSPTARAYRICRQCSQLPPNVARSTSHCRTGSQPTLVRPHACNLCPRHWPREYYGSNDRSAILCVCIRVNYATPGACVGTFSSSGSRAHMMERKLTSTTWAAHRCVYKPIRSSGSLMG